MSAEAIVAPLIPLAALAQAAAESGALSQQDAHSAQALAGAIRAQIDVRLQQAQEAAQAQRQERQQWRQSHHKHQAELAELDAARQAIEVAQQALAQNIHNAAAQDQHESAAPENRLDQLWDELRGFVTEVDAILAAAPAQLLSDGKTPFVKLRAQVEAWRQIIQDKSAPPRAEELDAFKQMLQRTLADHVERLRNTLRHQQQIRDNLLTILNEVTQYERLNGIQERHQQPLAQLREWLLEQLHADPLTLWMETEANTRFGPIKRAIDQELALDVARDALSQRLADHLSEMGYAITEPLAETVEGNTLSGAFAVPGGTGLHAVVHADGRIGFQLYLERTFHSDAPASAEELELLRRQERVWCQDLPEVMRRLSADGFASEVRFKRENQVENLPIVTVQSAEEINRAQQRNEQSAPRYQEMTFS
ncbi:hypothetical protein [Magnetofaba australis]|uniref:Uncharacterized protein n=1 Tax=Magnetofaba australis IT-1 TaxID=1434232 RepID=A0A1Y2K1Y8_9PROT|nr:hypothetical protein [Magnetofaba australis]OSM00341.1 hypothetical protein MAIT1_00838 [Magnetofaba australis IT-1]